LKRRSPDSICVGVITTEISRPGDEKGGARLGSNFSNLRGKAWEREEGGSRCATRRENQSSARRGKSGREGEGGGTGNTLDPPLQGISRGQVKRNSGRKLILVSFLERGSSLEERSELVREGLSSWGASLSRGQQTSKRIG